MDLVQETITLLELRLQSIRRQVGPLRKYRAGRNCQKGYNCGGSCITRRKNCRKALKGEAKNFSDWMVQKMSANIGAAVGDAPADVKRTPDGKPTSDINAYDMRAKGFDARKDKIVRKEDGGTYSVSSSGAFPDTLIEHDGVDARFKGGVRQSTDKRLKEAKRENAKDPYMSKEGAAERAAYIDEELKRRDDQRNAAKASNQKVLDDMEAKARQQREDQGLGKAKAEPKPEPKPQSRKDIEKTGIRMSTGETVKGERLGKALDQVANDIEQKARKARNDPGNYPPNVSDRIKDQYLESDLQRAQKIRDGKITNVSDLMRVNGAVTGNDAPILPKSEPKAKAKSKTKPKQAPDFDPSDTARGDQIKQLNEERAKQRREARAKSANKAEPKAKAKAEPKPPKDQKEFERSLNDIMGDKRAVSVAELRKTGLSDDQIAEFVRKGHENGTLVAQGGEGGAGFNPRNVAKERFGKEFKDLTGAEKQQMFKEEADRKKDINALGGKIFPGGRKVTEIRRP